MQADQREGDGGIKRRRAGAIGRHLPFASSRARVSVLPIRARPRHPPMSAFYSCVSGLLRAARTPHRVQARSQPLSRHDESIIQVGGRRRHDGA